MLSGIPNSVLSLLLRLLILLLVHLLKLVTKRFLPVWCLQSLVAECLMKHNKNLLIVDGAEEPMESQDEDVETDDYEHVVGMVIQDIHHPYK